MGPIWQAQLGESLVMLIGSSWEPNLLPYWAPHWGPLGKQDLCPNFALTAAKFLFSNSGNFKAKQFRQSPGLALNAHSGNEWGKIPVLTGILTHLVEIFISSVYADKLKHTQYTYINVCIDSLRTRSHSYTGLHEKINQQFGDNRISECRIAVDVPR